MSGMEVKGRRGKSKRTQNPNTAAVMNDPNAYKTFGNNYVWVPHPDEGFVVGEILAKNGADCEVQTEQGLKLTLPRTQLQPINPPKFDGVADMASLGYLNEPAVLHNLKQRYTLNQIYTYSGLFLVAVNPYKSLPLYGMDMVEKYKGRRREERDPHIYSVSDEAYRQMLMNKSNQSMLITGESGAGKTENTKKVIQYLTSVAGQHSASGRGLLEEQILQANPILESFGNAKTVKNNNSSRFGKFIEIQFNLGGLIVGSTISTYLLEKSRVVRQAPEERNFHIFYQLVQGASSEERAKYKLGNWKDYQYINQSDPFIEGVNDVKEFAETKKAMDIIGFTKEETDTVFKTTAAILHLGNLEFSEDSKHYAKVSNPETLNTVCQLLEIDPAKLTQALTNPNIVAGNEIVAVAQTVDQAVYNKDAMVKAVYGKLFDWIVKKINQTLSSKEKIATFIGVLDIAGFEIFQNNSFEQLCINYTNEKLQQFFNSHMFRKEQEEYIKEQIEWTFIDFGLDLQDTIDLIEKRNGIFALLDEQCLLGGSTEETLTLKFIQVHKDNAYFFTDQFSKTTFGIVHYAGDVVYDTAKWINKNVDPLHDDCKLAVSLSTNAIVRTFFPADAMQATAKGGNARGNARGATGAKFMTVSANYKQQLQTLMSILEATEPHFIRCIIPNLAKKPGVINNILVLDQLRCNGVLEGIRISRKGYPNRVPFEEFYRRYYLLAPKEQGEALIGFKAKAAFILQHIKAPEDQYKIGLTKIFLRTGQLPHLEELREARLSQIIICVQAAARGYLARKNYKKLKAKVEGIKLIQKNWRAHMDLRDWSWYGLFSKIRPLIGTMKKDEEFAAAKAEVDKLKKQLEEEAQRKKDLEAKKAEMEQLHAKLTKDIYSSQEEKQILNNKIGDLERKLNDLQVQVDKEARAREQLEKQKQQQDLALLERDSKIQDANSKFSNSTQEMERLKRELNELRNKLNDQDTKYTSLTNDKNGLERNYRELELRLQDELSQKDGLDKKTKNLNRNIEEYQNMIHKLEMEKTALEQEKKNVSGNLKTESGKAAAEAKAKEQALADYKKAQAELLRLQSELEEEKRQKAEFARKKTQLEGDLSNTSSNKEELERDKEVLARAKRGLESQLDELKFQMDHLNDNKAQLELLTQQQVGQLEDLKNQLNKANNNYTLLETAKTTLEKQIRENQSLYDEEINKAKQQLDTTKKRLEGDNASLKTALDDATNKGQKAERERVRLDRELKDTTSQLQAELANKNNLEETIRRLEAEIKDLKAKLEDETRRRNEAERLNKKLQQDLLTLKQMSEMDKTEQEKIERLTAQLKREIDDLSSKLSEEEDEKAAIEAAKDDLDKRFNDLQRNFTDKTAEVKKLEQSLVAQRKESDESKAALLAEEAAKYNSQLESTKKSLQSQIGDLTTELNNAKAEVEKYKRKQKADSGKLGQQLTEVQAAYATASADVKRLSDDLTSAKTQLEVALQQKADLESQKRNADSQLQKERLRAEDLESEKSKLSDANRKLQKELADATERADDEESEKDEASARADELKSKADALQRSLDAANARLAEADEERTRLRSELSNTKDNSTQANAKLAADLDAIKRKLESKVAELQKLLDAESSSKASLNEDKKDLQREIRDLQKENAALKQNQGGASTEQVRSLESQILKLQHELDEASRAKNGAEASQTSLQDKIRQLTMSLDEEARARKRAEEAKRKLTSDLESLQEDYEEVEESKTDLETAKSEIESQLAKLTTDLNRERDERQITQDSYQKLKREAEDALKQLKEEKSRAEEEKTRLKRKYEADIADMEEQVRRTFRNKSATSKSEKKLLRQVEELSRRVEDETRISQDAKDKASSLEKQMRMYSADIERLTTRARQAEQDKENVDKKTADLEEENEKIKRELNTLKSRYEQEARRRKAMDKKMRSVMVDSDDEF